jgi:hypothetical protein
MNIVINLNVSTAAEAIAAYREIEAAGIPVAPVTSTAAGGGSGARFRRTREEQAAGMSQEEARIARLANVSVSEWQAARGRGEVPEAMREVITAESGEMAGGSEPPADDGGDTF